MADDDDDKNNVDIWHSDVGHTPLPRLPEDDATPFDPATNPISDAGVDNDVQIDEAHLDPTHQVTDTNIEEGEMYDEGLTGAAEASEPNAGNAVGDYDPKKDSRKKL